MPKGGGLGREKQREEPSSVVASLQDFWEGTVPFCALLRAGSCWGPAHRSHQPCKQAPGGKSPCPWWALGEDHTPTANFAAGSLSSKPSCSCTLPAAEQGTRDAAAPGELPRPSPPGQQAARPWRGFAAQQVWRMWPDTTRQGSPASATGAILATVTTPGCPSEPPEMGEAPQLQERPAKEKVQKQLKLVIKIPNRKIWSGQRKASFPALPTPHIQKLSIRLQRITALKLQGISFCFSNKITNIWAFPTCTLVSWSFWSHFQTFLQIPEG